MGVLLLVPFFLIRFGLLSFLSREAVGRAAHFAPLLARERPFYWVYQLSNGAILVSLLFLRVRTAPAEGGIHENGLYRLSRNPMYLAYFVYFLGCALLTRSVLLLVFVLVFQLSAHWIIRSEERWCVQEFGEAYVQYMGRVRRYL